MSDQAAAPAPAGWYPDPQDASRGRFWNGTAWTDQYHQAGQPLPVAQLKAPPGTDWNTPWIWIIVLIPVITYIPLLFLPWHVLSHIDPNSPASIIQAEFDLLFSPAYIITVVLSLAVWVVSVLGALADYRELARRGVPRPFHWAFVFLGGVVYTIGRSVVVHRRTGKGHAPIFAEIGVVLLSLIVSGIITVMAVQAILTAVERINFS